MSDDHKELKKLEKTGEGQPTGDKSIKGETITTKEGNARSERQKLLDGLKSYKLTGEGQMSFQISGDLDGKSVEAKDARALRSSKEASSEPVEHARPTERIIGIAAHRPHEQMDHALAKLDHSTQSLRDDGRMSQKDYSKFKENMGHLRERVTRGYVDEKEAEKVYLQMDKLITEPEAVISEKNRILLAENVLYHAAWPHKIDQGEFQTCNMTTVEERLFTRHPSKAAEIITSASLHGSFVSEGKTIRVDGESLWPQKESLKSPPDPGDRSYASQVLNLLLVNDVVQRLTPPQYYSQIPSGHFGTGDGDATHRSATNLNESGERLTDGRGNEIRNIDDSGNDLGPMRGTGVAGHPESVADEVQRLTGDKNVVIANNKEDAAKNVLHVNSPHDLDAVLKGHKMPMILLIDANNPPWNNGAVTPAWHVLTIQSYDAQHQKAHISNQWGPDWDKDVPLNTLFEGTIECSTLNPPPAPVGGS